jgi:hypothetical protein
MASKRELQRQIKAAAARIQYELAEGIHTYSACDCGRNQTRGGKCWRCELEDLTTLYEKKYLKSTPNWKDG